MHAFTPYIRLTQTLCSAAESTKPLFRHAAHLISQAPGKIYISVRSACTHPRATVDRACINLSQGIDWTYHHSKSAAKQSGALFEAGLKLAGKGYHHALQAIGVNNPLPPDILLASSTLASMLVIAGVAGSLTARVFAYPIVHSVASFGFIFSFVSLLKVRRQNSALLAAARSSKDVRQLQRQVTKNRQAIASTLAPLSKKTLPVIGGLLGAGVITGATGALPAILAASLILAGANTLAFCNRYEQYLLQGQADHLEWEANIIDQRPHRS